MQVIDNLKLRIKAEPVTAKADATVYDRCLVFVYIYSYVYLAQKLEIYRSICSNRDRFVFYAHIRNIFRAGLQPQLITILQLITSSILNRKSKGVSIVSCKTVEIY